MEGLVTFCASVLQEDLRSPEVSIYGNGRNTANPKTVLIANTNQIKNFGKMSLLNNSRRYILVDPGEQPYLWGVVSEEGRVVGTSCYHYNPNDTENTYGLEVPQEVVSHYHLKEGDFVDLVVDRDRNIVYIESVNLMTDLSEIRNRPSSLVRFTSDYPEKPLPIEKYGNFDVRVMTLLSPIGLGSSHWIVAPGGSGKTWLLNEIFDSCLQLTYEMRNLFVIMVCVGDRPEDESVYLETFQKRKRKPRGDLYSASWNTHPDHQIEVVKFAKARADSLTSEGWDVVLIVDSITRTVGIHSSSSYVNSKSGMISGGIYRDSLTQMVGLLFGTHGNFTDPLGIYNPGSLTIVGTALEGSTDPISTDTKDSSTTGITTLRSSGDYWPRIDIHQTHVRLPADKDFRPNSQRIEMDYVRDQMSMILSGRKSVGMDRSVAAYKSVLDHVRKYPKPDDFERFIKSKISP